MTIWIEPSADGNNAIYCWHCSFYSSIGIMNYFAWPVGMNTIRKRMKIRVPHWRLYLSARQWCCVAIIIHAHNLACAKWQIPESLQAFQSSNEHVQRPQAHHPRSPVIELVQQERLTGEPYIDIVVTHIELSPNPDSNPESVGAYKDLAELRFESRFGERSVWQYLSSIKRVIKLVAVRNSDIDQQSLGNKIKR